MRQDKRTQISRTQLWLNSSWRSQQHELVLQAYKQFSDTPELAPILEDLARYAGLRQSSFNPDQPHQMAFSEGQRDLLLHFLEMAEMDLAIAPKAKSRQSESTFQAD